MCFPTFFLILAVLAWFPPRIENVMIVIGRTR
jgi:ABC-type dipeptide/oligopeptide/nickel transport system permease subunit